MNNTSFNPENKKDPLNNFVDHQAVITDLVKQENEALQQLAEAVEKNLEQAKQKN